MGRNEEVLRDVDEQLVLGKEVDVENRLKAFTGQLGVVGDTVLDDNHGRGNFIVLHGLNNSIVVKMGRKDAYPFTTETPMLAESLKQISMRSFLSDSLIP